MDRRVAVDGHPVAYIRVHVEKLGDMADPDAVLVDTLQDLASNFAMQLLDGRRSTASPAAGILADLGYPHQKFTVTITIEPG